MILEVEGVGWRIWSCEKMNKSWCSFGGSPITSSTGAGHEARGEVWRSCWWDEHNHDSTGQGRHSKKTWVVRTSLMLQPNQSFQWFLVYIALFDFDLYPRVLNWRWFDPILDVLAQVGVCSTMSNSILKCRKRNPASKFCKRLFPQVRAELHRKVHRSPLVVEVHTQQGWGIQFQMVHRWDFFNPTSPHRKSY